MRKLKKPFIKIVSTYDKYEETTTRYMKCKYCNSEDIKIKIDQRNSKSKPKNINKNRKTCRGCGKKVCFSRIQIP
ncbi:hypothetical protein [Methanosarcina barkeri]|uniref:hypothetical protein n=1 Tax=Methanosarcina barkeri TaxID=2208 RepID=UPI0006CF2DE8|nr:hypothetical protein [Methanosarcina barkeri]